MVDPRKVTENGDLLMGPVSCWCSLVIHLTLEGRHSPFTYETLRIRNNLLQVRAWENQSKNQNPHLFDSQMHTLPTPGVSKAINPKPCSEQTHIIGQLILSSHHHRCSLRKLQASTKWYIWNNKKKMKPVGHSDYHATMVSFLSVPRRAKGYYKCLSKEWINY